MTLQFDKENKRSKQALKDLDKICIVKPEPRDSNLSEALFHLAKIAEEAGKRIVTYPPSSIEDDLYYRNGISILIDYLKSLADMKWSRSVYSWIDIDNEKHTQSTHSAMSKSKIESIKGELRKVTREQIDSKDPVIIELANRIVEASEFIVGKQGLIIKNIFESLLDGENPAVLEVALRIIENAPFLIALDIYKDKCQAPYTADFHLRRHDKLSESAFGNSTMQQ